jgi:deoxycytidine triphosphate deaminase
MVEEQKYSQQNVTDFLCERSCSQSVGALSDQGIKRAIYDHEIFIYPYEENCVTPIGYNFCPSEIIISTKTGLPINICQKGNEEYVMVEPHDTILISTREYLSIGSNIMGTFHSKVTVVSAGFGHISTTLDAGWRGPLLVALNNPSSRKLKLTISNNNHPVPFVTLIFYRFYEESCKQHDNPPYRTDVLKNCLAKASLPKQVIFKGIYDNYILMIDMISNAMNLEYVQENAAPILNELEQCLCRLKNLYITMQIDSDDMKIAEEDLIRCISKGKLQQEFSSDLSEMLKCLQLGIEYFGIGQEIWQNTNMSFEEAMLPYMDLCYMRIQDEKIGRYWVHRYEEIRKLAITHGHRRRWILGVRWGKVFILSFFTILCLGTIIYIGICKGEDVYRYILAPIFAAIITNVILSAVKDS